MLRDNSLHVRLVDPAARKYYDRIHYFDTSNSRLEGRIGIAEFLNRAIRLAPRDFTLVTKSNRYQVNSGVLRNVSPGIDDIVRRNPEITEFDLEIDAPDSIMTRVVSVLLGGTESFIKSEYKAVQLICNSLKVASDSFPWWMCAVGDPYYHWVPVLHSKPKASEVSFTASSLANFIDAQPKTFHLQLKDNNYAVSDYSIALSPFLLSHRDSKSITLDYEDESGHFRILKDYLNGIPILLTPDNATALRQIAVDIQLDCFITQIDKFIQSFEKNQEKLGFEVESVDAHICLQNMLLGLDESNFESTIRSLLSSRWFLDRESVKEFVSNILAVVGTRFLSLGMILGRFVQQLHEALEDDFFLTYLIRRILTSVVEEDRFSRFTFALYHYELLRIEQITQARQG